MRKISMLLSTLVLAAMVLAACGGGATSTNVASSPPPVTVESTEALSTATEAPTEVGATTETPGVPVTGDINPARLSNQLEFTVWSQDGEQIGEVNDMVLDLDNRQVAYVVVGTGGFLDLGERDILVPWEMLQLQTGMTGGTGTETTGTDQATATADTGTGGTSNTPDPNATATTSTGGTGTDQATATAETGTGGTGTGAVGQQNAFILQTDLDTFRNAPDFDLSGLPQMGQPAGDWDVDIRNYWQGGGTGTGTGTGTDQATATAGTGTDLATATPGTGTDLATATTDTSSGGTGTGTDQGNGQANALQGVVLATDVLGSTVTVTGQGNEGQGTGAGTDLATATPGTGTDQSTATPEAGTDQGLGNMDVTIDDMIVDTDTGEILYIVVNTMLDEGERWIPLPLSIVQWNAGNGAFVLNTNPAAVRDAPFFQDGQFPDTTMSGWNSEFDTYWQNNGGTGGTGTGIGGNTGTLPTATP